MKRVWNKETRNRDGAYYRRGDWGVDVADDWDNGGDNFTEVSPPEDAMRLSDPLPVDWSDADGAFIPATEDPLYDEYVRGQRRREYPPIGDQLDAIMKQLAEDKTNGHAMLPEMDTILDAVAAVKARHPKGE